MVDAEKKLAYVVRALWNYYNDDANLEPEDIDGILTEAGMVITVEATADDIDDDNDIEFGDPLLQLTPEAEQLLEKYKHD